MGISEWGMQGTEGRPQWPESGEKTAELRARGEREEFGVLV